tara:strand:+ start:464 stop:1132 length:669 start_codon:yes stop_codon:yes gene_type:complete
MSETLMTEANQPNEGGASQTPNEASTDVEEGMQQEAVVEQNQEAQDEATAGKEESDTPEDGAPEKYEFNEVADAPQELDAEVLEAYSEVAKDLNLSQENAQKVLDKVAPVIQARQAKVLEEARNQWAETSASDQEFGGENLNANLETAKRAMDNFGTKEFSALLHESGLGNHPEVIRFMFRAGKAISEDTYVGNSEGSTGTSRTMPKDMAGMADALYSNQQS